MDKSRSRQPDFIRFIPLLYPDPDATLDLNNAIHELYQLYRYDVVIDYDKPVPNPALRPKIASWWQTQKERLHQQA